MTPRQYSEAIAALNLTQVGAAKFLGVDPRTSRHWAAGTAPVPLATAKLLWYMVGRNLTPRQIDRVAAAMHVKECGIPDGVTDPQ